ncbi:MAG: hypothetical protein C0630_16505 [Sedimenticola selenatireducens]|uniref:Uncharacterized protein n=1 Tax=Sedimenticola selenatireducens TaxID=191960 RepID=A0A2N6CTF2_9GAMM|nr:MAG: hypothetical protein C0630_16505 [Sedimenticola selenatireducens]
MIELPITPTIRVMTAGTVIRKRAFVHIIRRMTIHTRLWRLFIIGIQMTTTATHRLVQSDQRKIGKAMIKNRLSCPTFLSMTALALLSLLTFMPVISFMTSDALLFQFHFLDTGLMAGDASNLFVSTQ